MRYPIHRPTRLGVAATVLASIIAIVVAALVVVLGHSQSAAATHSCSGVHINPGNDLDAIVNRDPGYKATTFCVHAATSGTTYTINNTVVLKPGDRLLGQPGQVITRGPASYGVPPVKIRDGASLVNLIDLRGSNQLKWLDIAGGEVGILAYAGGNPDDRSLMEYLTIHDNGRSGIRTMHGKLLHSNLYNNGTDPAYWGNTAAAVKGTTEYEAAYNYVHDNPANALWCDHECGDAGAANPNGFWAHHNLVVRNGRSGIRYEFAPIVGEGVHRTQPTALIENNEVHENGSGEHQSGGISVWEAQNAVVRNNRFGAVTIGGVAYGKNNFGLAIRVFDSGRSDRTDLWNADVLNNVLNGEVIKGCELPDNVVYCANNK